MVSIKGLDTAEVLVALRENSYEQGLGVLAKSNNGLTVKEARNLLRKGTHFGYLKGKVLKVDLSGDEFDEYLYDRDLGAGTAERVIDELRRKSAVNVDNMSEKPVKENKYGFKHNTSGSSSALTSFFDDFLKRNSRHR